MNIAPIATIDTPFSEKFAIPRQAQVVQQAMGAVRFTSGFCHADSLDGLTAHSHYWLIWGFHINEHKDKPLTVRPPRLGGNKRVGVFATRSPFRPNNLGLSVVKLESVNHDQFSLIVSGVDMLTGSPIYDIKPYVPYADKCLDAHSDWAESSPESAFTVQFSPAAEVFLQDYDAEYGLCLQTLISALLSYDPRPAYKTDNVIDDKRYATRLYDVEIAWHIHENTVTVIEAGQG